MGPPRPWCVGIAGASGTGKTALALRLVEALAPEPALHLPLDAYYRDLGTLSAELRERHNFDHPDSLDRGLFVSQLRALRRGRAVEMPVYRFETHSRAPAGRRVTPGRAVVVEGLFTLLWPEVRRRLDLQVFVEADDALCLERRLARDAAERGRTPRSVREQYRATVRPMYERWVLPTRGHADLVLDGARPLQELCRELLDRLP